MKTSFVKRSMRIFATTVLLGVTAQVLAAEWHSLDGAQGMQVQMDLNSIVPAGDGLIKAWVTHSFEQKKTSVEYPTFYYQSAVILEIYDCKQRTTDSLQEVFYSEAMRGGDVVKTRSYPRKDLKFTDVVPGTVGEGSLEFACSYFSTKQKLAKSPPGRPNGQMKK